MDISSLLNTNPKLKQKVRSATRQGEVLDICLTNLFANYDAPIIIPPVQPDVPGQGFLSDHSVPLCVPHTDPSNPSTRVYRTIVSRPLPDSKVREFGQWITSQSWDIISLEDEPTKQVHLFENLVTQKLNDVFPQKITKLGLEDKPFMTSELKALKRKRMRKFKLKGKSVKYKRLKAEYDEKFEKDGFNFFE